MSVQIKEIEDRGAEFRFRIIDTRDQYEEKAYSLEEANRLQTIIANRTFRPDN